MTVRKDDICIQLFVERNVLCKEDEEIVLDIPARFVDDQLFVPLQVIRGGLEVRAEYFESSHAVKIWVD